MSQAQDTDRIKFDDRDYRVTCTCCGTQFEATRSDASFCSARCRVRWSKRPQQRLNAIAHVEAMAVQLRDYRSKFGADKRFLEALNTLDRAVDTFKYHIELEG